MSQDEYFSVDGHLKINAQVLNEGEKIPSPMEFKRSIPLSFRIANQCGYLDQGIENEIQLLNHEKGHALSTYLHTQNEKINLLLSFMLSQQDDPTVRYQTETFGASGLTFIAQTPFIKDSAVRLKLFLDTPPSAIYCYGRVHDCKEKNEKFTVGIKYVRLQEEDRDILIRAALQHQQKLLRHRALERNN